MSQTEPASDSPEPLAAPRLDALRQRGAAHVDALRFHYAEALSRRVERQQGSARHLLDARLTQVLDTLDARLAAPPAVAHHGDRRGTVASPLAELLKHVEQAAGTDDHARATSIASATARPELKAVRYFRNSLARLSVDQQVSQAIDRGPENAGPLNSHQLLLRSLTAMRDISPDYLSRFVSYVDTLLSLDQAEKDAKPTVKRPARAKASKR